MEELIYSYTRKQAIEDGVLVNVTGWAREAGIKYPVAMTDTVWRGYIEPAESVKHFQDTTGRLWDVLNCLRFAALNSNGEGNEVRFRVLFQMKPDTQEEIMLKAICGPGDTAEPVITVMFPEED